MPAGERALVWIGNYSKARCAFDMSDASVRQALTTLAGDPKVAGYYLADEADDALPTYGGHCPHVATQVTQRNRLVHQLAPGAFTYEVVTEPGNFAAFAHATDVMGADPYPCLRGRACDWSEIPAYIAALNAAHVPRYWALLQAFGYGKWRAPTADELARMSAMGSLTMAGRADVLVELPQLLAEEPPGPARGAEEPERRQSRGCVGPLRQYGSAGAHIRAYPGVHIDRRGLLRPGKRCGLGVIRHRLQHHHPLARGDHQHRHRSGGRHPRDQSPVPKQSDCAGSVKARQLKAGAVIAYECESDHIFAPATLIQTVTVSADPPAGPFVTPASSAATARVAPSPRPVSGAISARLQVCVLPKQASCDPTKAADWASSGPLHQQTAMWRL